MPTTDVASLGETRILFVGDMHLGRTPARVPTALGPHGLEPRDLGPAAAWANVIAWAIEHRVHAVALAGDLVDGDNALFEAYGELQRGIGTLVAAGIEVCAVAGNHDTAVLPRLAAVIGERLHLLGRGGQWAAQRIAPADGPQVRLVGWSFPAPHHDTSPLLSAPPPPQPGLVTLGVLHADLDTSTSLYAPVAARALQAVGYQGWFLGHLHQPGQPSTDGAPFYLGSISALDPTETGLHGPVLVRVAADGRLQAERAALAPLRWEKLHLTCPEPGPDARDLEGALLAAMIASVSDLGPQLAAVKAVGFRIALQGRVADSLAVSRAAERITQEGRIFDRGDVKVFLERVTSEVAGLQDLAALAERQDPIGLLARKVLALENPEGTVPGVEDPSALASALSAVAQARAEHLARDPNYVLLDPQTIPAGPREVRRLLTKAGRLALDHLLTGEEGGRAAR